MKKRLWFFSVLCGVLLIGLSAESKAVVEQGYQAATVISVEKYQPVSNYLGDNPADAPLQAREYAYDIGIRLDCNVYVGRYQSAINYLPSGFAPNQIRFSFQEGIQFIFDFTPDKFVKVSCDLFFSMDWN